MGSGESVGQRRAGSHAPAEPPCKARLRASGTWPAANPLLCLALFMLLLFMLLAPSIGSAGDAYHPALDPERFPVPETLIPNVEFWREIFATYSSDQTVVHDDRYLRIVYGVVESKDLEKEGRSPATVERLRDRKNRKELDRYRAILRHLAGNRNSAGLDPAEVDRVSSLFADTPAGRSKFRDAVRRVRGQDGLKDHFEEAIRISGMFMPGIERILATAEVPAEIKCMPFVESMFNFKARSKVGASGAWQFTRSTGRLYLQIDSAVDARSDVLLAAEGAAKMLADNYRRVQSWPLALTGYNHGIAGMQRAARKLGTRDIGVVSEKYRSRTFGFASRNFYAEFVAATVVYSDRTEYFPGVEPLAELRFDEFAPARFVSLLDLAQLTETVVENLEELNPALSPEVIEGRLLVPKDYRLRVPPGTRAAFERAYDRLPAQRRVDRQLATRYRVKRGDTLGAIARRYGTSVRSMQRANGLPRADRIYVGQVLELPGRGRDWGPLVMPEERESRVASRHVVRSGETLGKIAERYRIGVDTLASANSLRSPDLLRVGEELVIPGSGDDVASAPGPDKPKVHRVRAGDTLFRIAANHGISVRSLMRSNGLSTTLILVGQVLQIPPS